MQTIKEIRRSNCQYIIDTRYRGVVNRLAIACGMHSAQLARIFTDNENRREIGDTLARRIEKAVGLEHGWLDQQHASGDVLSTKIALLDTQSRVALEAIIDCLLARVGGSRYENFCIPRRTVKPTYRI